MIEFRASQADEGRTIENVVLRRYKNISRSQLYKLLRLRDVKINDIRVNKNVVLCSGDVVKLYININSDKPYDIIYQDEKVLFLNKRQGIPVQPDKSGELSLEEIVKAEISSDASPCHRLDRNTGGILIFSMDNRYKARIIEAINNRYYKKIYTCIVSGSMSASSETLRAWLFKDSRASIVYIYDYKRPHTLPIETKYNVISYDSDSDISTLEIELITGRTHQIRAHLAHIGHPILFDGKYGDKSTSASTKSASTFSTCACKYQALWASSLIYERNDITSKYRGLLPEQSFYCKPEFK